MKEKLKQFGADLGIEYIGICPVGPYQQLAERLAVRIACGQYTSFEGTDIVLRTQPQLTMAGAQSIVVCLFPYYAGDSEAANLAKYARGADYHSVIKEKLNRIGMYLQSEKADFAYIAFADNGPLVDRYLAYLAGLGFYGINSHIINEKYGSYFFVGYLLTNYPFAADRPLDRTCVQCGACITACPGRIILGDFNIDPRYCRSYLTQKKGLLTDHEIAVIKKTNLVFGCDVCQDVCPHNQGVSITPLDEFRMNLVQRLDCGQLKSLSNKEFMRCWGDRAFSWRGKQILIRNWEYINGRAD